jgi:hypothetical protein
MFGLLSDPYFVLLILFCAAVITIGSLVTALKRTPRADFARSQSELKELSGQVKALEAAEQRRFLRELNFGSKGAEATYTDSGGGRLVAEGKEDGDDLGRSDKPCH